MSTVIQLRRRPAYKPLDPPGTCQTPGHDEREARDYPGGRLCDECIRKSRQANSSNKKGRHQ